MDAITYPAIPHYNITYFALEFYISQIPIGRVLTERELLAFLRTLYDDKRLDVDHDGHTAFSCMDSSIPYWRYLSTSGLTQADRSETLEKKFADILETEGHRISQTKHGRYKVDDYKETMADTSLFRVLPADKALIRVNDRPEPYRNRICIHPLLIAKASEKADE